MADWQPIETAPENVEVLTKIDDGAGVRNEQSLKRQGGLWFVPDMSMYVYYRPTHWKPLTEPTDILAVAKAIVARAMKEGDVPSIRQLARDYIRLREADRQRRATDAVAGAVMPRVPPGRGL